MPDPVAVPADAPQPDAPLTPRQLHTARAAEIVHQDLARARALGSQYREVQVLLPIIEATLVDLFGHMSKTPDEYAAEVAADKAAADKLAADEKAAADKAAADQAAVTQADRLVPRPAPTSAAGGSYVSPISPPMPEPPVVLPDPPLAIQA